MRALEANSVYVQEMDPSEMMHRWPPVRLASAKMRGLRDLLLADKLNSQAISLQLTAQSQVSVPLGPGVC